MKLLAEIVPIDGQSGKTVEIRAECSRTFIDCLWGPGSNKSWTSSVYIDPIQKTKATLIRPLPRVEFFKKARIIPNAHQGGFLFLEPLSIRALRSRGIIPGLLLVPIIV